MKKVGLFGGTFDPVHNAHIDLALRAKERLNLSEVWFLPDRNPRRKNQKVLDYSHRLAMIKLACEGHSGLVVDRLDQQKYGTTYNLKETNRLISQFPGYEFTLLIGSDALEYFEHWDDPEEFCGLLDFGVFLRKAESTELLNALTERFDSFNYQLICKDVIPTSSSEIRSRVQSKKQISDLNPKVLEYIKENKLYE